MESGNDKAIGSLYADAEYWHGTGRYKYNEHGSIRDVLKGIIAEGGLVPHEDDWDPKRGKIQSISLARARMYARLYACMHMPCGARLTNELGPRHFWGYCFFLSASVVAHIEYPLQRHIHDYPNKLREWTGKVSKRPHTLKSIFLEGTDIPDNYPILIGIKKGSVQPKLGSRFFNLHEARSEALIRFSDMTHIEVPEVNVAETTALLRSAGHDIPIILIEEGEDYCRTFSFWQLVNGRPLVD